MASTNDDARVETLDDIFLGGAHPKGDVVKFETVGIPRDRWSSRWTFVLGAVGSAVGLGNLWRFPMLVYRYGGGSFLIPYFISIVGLGMPLLLLELTLGRYYQGGDAKGKWPRQKIKLLLRFEL